MALGPSDSVVRVAPLMSIPRLLAEEGIDAADVLGEFGLAADHFDHPENLVTADVVGRLLGRCAEKSGIAHFGLLVGQRAGASAMGPVGFLMQSASDVGTALRKFVEGFHTHDRVGTIDFRDDGAFATLSYALVRPDIENSDQILDTAIAVGANILRGLCGSQWRPAEVRLSHRRPRNVAPYRQYFGVTPTFDAEWSGFVFASSWLRLPASGADPLLHELMETRVRELVASTRDDLAEVVRRILRRSLSLEDCRLTSVAKALHTTERTLNRRLQAEGTTFRSLREEVRFDSARQLVANTTLSATEIASTLGYSDASAFIRAFERWSGTSPTRWRLSQATKRPKRHSAGA